MANVIITGSTGMVGKGVLLECLESSKIDKILVVNRSTVGINHPKLTEILLSDFLEIAKLKDQLKGFDACFYCMGISVVGLNEETYNRITYLTTKAFVEVLFELNPQMVFNYVSGAGTDSSEKGRSMWARIKGKTENMVFAKGFKDSYAFRPGAIIPEKGIKSRTGWYNFFYAITRPLFPLLKRSKNVTTTTKIGLAMINLVFQPSPQKVLENIDINELSRVG